MAMTIMTTMKKDDDIDDDDDDNDDGNDDDDDDNDNNDDNEDGYDDEDDNDRLSSFAFICLHLPSFAFPPVLALKSLPLLPASSSLKKLNAEHCDIQSLPDNLFHHQLEEINLKGNKG